MGCPSGGVLGRREGNLIVLFLKTTMKKTKQTQPGNGGKAFTLKVGWTAMAQAKMGLNGLFLNLPWCTNSLFLKMYSSSCLDTTPSTTSNNLTQPQNDLPSAGSSWNLADTCLFGLPWVPYFQHSSVRSLRTGKAWQCWHTEGTKLKFLLMCFLFK